MPRLVDGTRYFTATEIAKDLSVTRQTMWRWRTEGKIPAGHRFRDRQVMFTEVEVGAIRLHANRVEPIPVKDPDQLQLFK